MDFLPWKSLHDIRDIVDIIDNTSVEIFEAKKKELEEGDEAVTQQIGQGKDIMSILSAYWLAFFDCGSLNSCIVKANMSASEEDRMSNEELLGQMR
jgi:hypothetical protein